MEFIQDLVYVSSFDDILIVPRRYLFGRVIEFIRRYYADFNLRALLSLGIEVFRTSLVM
jgi:hypothetical protein